MEVISIGNLAIPFSLCFQIPNFTPLLQVSQYELKTPCCFYGIKANKPKDYSMSNYTVNGVQINGVQIYCHTLIAQIIVKSQQGFMDSKQEFNW